MSFLGLREWTALLQSELIGTELFLWDDTISCPFSWRFDSLIEIPREAYLFSEKGQPGTQAILAWQGVIVLEDMEEIPLFNRDISVVAINRRVSAICLNLGRCRRILREVTMSCRMGIC
jgi:hypothetical protein